MKGWRARSRIAGESRKNEICFWVLPRTEIGLIVVDLGLQEVRLRPGLQARGHCRSRKQYVGLQGSLEEEKVAEQRAVAAEIGGLWSNWAVRESEEVQQLSCRAK